MRILTNANAEAADPSLRYQAYNAMDACLTVGIHNTLQRRLARLPDEALVYRFELAMQGPAHTMACRGIAVDENVAKAETDRLLSAEARCIANLRHCAAVWTEAGSTDTAEIIAGLRTNKLKGLNPHSGKQVQELLYLSCGEKPYKSRPKPGDTDDEGKDTVAEEALMMLQARSPIVGIMAHLILRARELRKLRSFIAARRSPDGRLRSSFNVGATTSGRWSFSKNCFRDGLNFGNIPKRARSMFIPSSPDHVMVNVDLSQAESYVVGIISGDDAYVAAHETGDAHGAVALDVYGHMMPAGADFATWIRQPNPNLPRGESPRQACKKMSHGCLTEDHEVLTPHGWIGIAAAREQHCPIFVDGVGFEKPSDWYDAIETSGDLYEFEGQGYSQLVTSDHTMLTRTGKVAADSVARHHRLRRTALPYTHGTPSELNARLSAALFADGHQTKHGRTNFHFRKQRKIDRLLNLAGHLNPDIYKNKDGTVRISFKDFPVEKKPASVAMLAWDIPTIRAYLDETAHWDGTIGKTGFRHISTVSATHAEWLQTLCHIAGYGSQRHKLERDESRQPIWRVSINCRQFARASCMEITTHPAAGIRILCPVTSTGAFLVRRHGHISVSGNTNYGLGERKASKITGMLISDITAFRHSFFTKYAGVAKRIAEMPARLRADRHFLSVVGRPHWHSGHPNDAETHRSALADEPQGVVADILNVALWRLWRWHDVGPLLPHIEVLAQNYDSILFECHRDDIDAARAACARAFNIPIEANGRTYVIPHDFGSGRNWKEACA